ncbi:ferrous iron transport protein B [Cerasicoccus fimbriatus]|uniref:ferrous iron transport protein B n=1 Tax=Cerasicoccus fimbriatus TaxID=3014554 RepID=UPI0022B3E185|nr:ferrous iron transport protein B [Cerasicoccus sp. TK19100]
MTVSAAPAPAQRAKQIALIGNPNTGKTSLFNCLTGMRQRVGNYPGVTVEKKMGIVQLDGGPATLIDLPGAYSLSASSLDERVAVDVLSGHLPGINKPDAVVCVVDATNLKRNLFLALQIAELGMPMVIALNMSDGLEQRGQTIDTAVLEKRLGVPVVATVARKSVGIAELRDAINTAIAQERCLAPMTWPAEVNEAVKDIQAAAEGHTAVPLTELEIRRMLFDAGSAVMERVQSQGEAVRQAVNQGREKLRKLGLNPMAAEAVLSYKHLDKLLEGVVRQASEPKREKSESIDKLLLHRGWGLVIFAAMMYVVFQSVYTWAGPLMDLVDAGKGWVQALVGGWLEPWPMLGSLMTDGIIEGVGAFVIFLPQILILFFFIALLEDTGYMARAAFLMDRLFGWCGLNGKSFVPMLSGYACAIPGILAARTIEDPKARIVTILLTPLMSCSARLPVYILLIGAFVEPRYGPFIAGLSLFVMHIVGLLVAVPAAWVLTRFVVKTKPQPFVLEMPTYRVPRLQDVLYRMGIAGKEFVTRAGTVILAITVIVWALLYFPRSESLEQQVTEDFIVHQAALAQVGADAIETQLADPDSELSAELTNAIDAAYINQSYMARIGKTIQPIFAPAGFDWKITVGVVASFPAREVIISTLGIIYSLGGDVDEESPSLTATLANAEWPDGPKAGQPIFTLPVAFAIMVFFALCQQCGATVAVMAKEIGWSWAIGSFVAMTSIAWVGAVIVYQVGTAIGL